jgi:hypothetical protein
MNISIDTTITTITTITTNITINTTIYAVVVVEGVGGFVDCIPCT